MRRDSNGFRNTEQSKKYFPPIIWTQKLKEHNVNYKKMNLKGNFAGRPINKVEVQLKKINASPPPI